MRILHLIPDFNYGGTEVMVHAIAAAQTESGHDVIVAGFCDPPGSFFSQFQDTRVFKAAEAHLSLFKPSRATSGFDIFLREFSPEIVHSHSAWTDLILATSKTHIFGQVTHFHLLYDLYKRNSLKQWATLKVEIGRRLLLAEQRRRRTQYIACSKHCADFYRSNFPGSARQRLHVLDNFCRLPVNKSARKIPPTIGHIRLVTVSRLEPIKNVGFAIDVLESLVKDCGVSAQLSIAGEGSLERELKDKVLKKGLSKYIRFLGNQNDITSLYDNSDLLIHGSHEESFGLVLIEAMARGLPFLANEELTVVHHLLGEDASEATVSLSYPNLAAKKVLALLRNPFRYHHYSFQAIAKANKFTVDAYLPKLECIYNLAK